MKQATGFGKLPWGKSRVFISVPMHGRENADILADINAAAVTAKARLGEDSETVSAYTEEDLGLSSLGYLGRAIGIMATCDTIFLCDGWERARGCRVEVAAAREYGLTVIDIWPEAGDE